MTSTNIRSPRQVVQSSVTKVISYTQSVDVCLTEITA